jgi:hypothetical protein
MKLNPKKSRILNSKKIREKLRRRKSKKFKIKGKDLIEEKAGP